MLVEIYQSFRRENGAATVTVTDAPPADETALGA